MNNHVAYMWKLHLTCYVSHIFMCNEWIFIFCDFFVHNIHLYLIFCTNDSFISSVILSPIWLIHFHMRFVHMIHLLFIYLMPGSFITFYFHLFFFSKWFIYLNIIWIIFQMIHLWQVILFAHDSFVFMW